VATLKEPRVRRILLTLAAATLSLSIAIPTAAAKPRALPPELQVPAGHQLVLSAPAKGVQIYDCTNGAWSFREPAAVLTAKGKTVALHYAGPTWQSVNDGSKTVGTVLARAAAPCPERDIPWLLLTATSIGPGVFADVDFIQRLNTTGGVAPAGSCQAGQSVAVAYTATYNFWASTGD
jgi:hypothetical protein